MGSRERLAAPRKQNGDERKDVDITPMLGKSTILVLIYLKQYSLSIGSLAIHMLTEETAPPPISDEYQPLLRKLTQN